MIDYMCSFPATSELGAYTTGCSGANEKDAKESALRYYNSERYAWGLKPLPSVPDEVTITPCKSSALKEASQSLDK